jgi:2-methylisocitrate lyase-like PEP mutase family enzyme
MVAKIKAACDARRDRDFVIIARCDAIAVEGLEPALERGERYREAGADVLFIEAPVGREQVEIVSKRFKGVPLLYNMAASGKTPDLPADELGRLGFKLAIYPNWVILAAIPAMRGALRELKQSGSIAGLRGKAANFKEFTEIAGLPEIQQLEEKYGLPEDQRAGL